MVKQQLKKQKLEDAVAGGQFSRLTIGDGQYRAV